jgi:hypothetical protein
MLILFTRTSKLSLLTLLSRLEMSLGIANVVRCGLNKIISCCEIGFSPECYGSALARAALFPIKLG